MRTTTNIYLFIYLFYTVLLFISNIQQSLSLTVLFRIALTGTIILDKLLMLQGSNHLLSIISLTHLCLFLL